jgi:hypothetical protein
VPLVLSCTVRARRNVLTVGLCCALAMLVAACGGADEGGDGGLRAGAQPAFALGINANTVGWGPRVGAQQDLVKQLGVRWIREELYWKRVAPRRGARAWAFYDRLFVAASHRGLRILPLLNDPPAWAGGHRGALPTDAVAYAAFVRDAVRRYGPSGTFWNAHPKLDARLAPRWFELWNEPFFARPIESTLSARRYARLADAALAAGHAANPEARFLISVQTRTQQRPQLDTAWLDHLLAARPRLLEHADGVTAHPYDRDVAGSLDALRAVRVALRERGAGALPIWVTEVGWSTCAGATYCVSEREQAGAVSRFLRTTVRERLADAVFVYHLLSWRLAPGENGGDFGLLRRDGTRKSSWRVIRRSATSLIAAGAP